MNDFETPKEQKVPTSEITKEVKPSPELTEEQIEQAEGEASNFVSENTVLIVDNPAKSSGCIDPRLSKFIEPIELIETATREHKKFPASFPGADLGGIMVMLEVMKNVEAKEIVSLMLKFVAEKGDGVLNYHSDEHHDHDKSCGLIGCGHANAAFVNNEYYGFLKDKLKEAVDYLDKLYESGDERVDKDILVGDHNETGVLVVKSEKNTVKHIDENGKQYFVYDVLSHMKYIDMLTEFLNDNGYSVDVDEMKKAAERQATATLANLASSKGKPIFEVSYDDDNNEKPIVKYTGVAPTT